MGEWLAVLIGVRNDGEEIVRRTDRVVTDGGNEASRAYGPVVVGQFGIKVRNGDAVERAVGAPPGLEAGRSVPAIIRAVERIGSHAPVPAAAFGLGHAAEAVPGFCHLVVVRAVGPGHRAVEAIVGAVWIPDQTLIEPAVVGPLAVLAAGLVQLPGFAEIGEQAAAGP